MQENPLSLALADHTALLQTVLPFPCSLFKSLESLLDLQG